MRYLNAVAAVVMLAGLAACSSTPIQDRYYSLVLASGNAPVPGGEDATGGRMVVGPIVLARYLDQSGLALQTGSSEIQSARHHFWAESLDEAIAKVLVQDIARGLNNVNVEREAGRWSSEVHCRVRVEFDKFHATTNSEVHATGRYWLHGVTPSTVSRQEFDIVNRLSADGYAHAVSQLRSSLASLAARIVEHAEVEPACTAAP